MVGFRQVVFVSLLLCCSVSWNGSLAQTPAKPAPSPSIPASGAPAPQVIAATPTTPVAAETKKTPEPVSDVSKQEAEFCLTQRYPFPLAQNATDEQKKIYEEKQSLTADKKAQRLININQGELTNAQSTYGGPIVVDSYLLPSGSIDVGIDRPFSQDRRYYAYLLSEPQKKMVYVKNVRSWQATDNHPLVKKQKLTSGATIVNLKIPDQDAFAWKALDLYVFTCKVDTKKPQYSNPDLVSQLSVRVSPGFYSGLAAWIAVGIFYLFAVFAFRTGNEARWWSYLNPIRLTAGIDGRASLGKLQILMFSMVVFGLIVFLLFRTGVLTEISGTILTLLGIAGFGATAAKGADLQRTTLSLENKAYLTRKGWLAANQQPAKNVATWRDLLTTDGEFDVYRYQSAIFGIAVAGALLFGGVTQLSSFEIPTNFLGLLGLSQVVYVGGKLVTPTSMSELNKLLSDMSDAEKKFVDTATAVNNGALPLGLAAAINPATQATYDTYKKLANDARTLVSSQLGIAVDPARLEPDV